MLNTIDVEHNVEQFYIMIMSSDPFIMTSEDA
jgi:hypothetical protein